MKINMVKDFLQKFGRAYDGPPRELPYSVARARITLLREELEELITALEDGDPVETLDAMVDLQYVLTGTVILAGYDGVFDEAFRRVHESNMAKVAATSRSESKRNDRSDIVKPPHWKKADLSDLIGG